MQRAACFRMFSGKNRDGWKRRAGLAAVRNRETFRKTAGLRKTGRRSWLQAFQKALYEYFETDDEKDKAAQQFRIEFFQPVAKESAGKSR